ncbi:MFS transporter [Sphingobium sp. CR2-8]|uniref:MFS transporter n=1 Tax=Sphingobium sp. CR2-8 TaxID=1306534 RepID=UPI002DBF9746|nr:MFS transporter [Sphingobium sp. CR2-8]MEC3912449.1 MFS transporter [Sphingobium sp. CR2-8]
MNAPTTKIPVAAIAGRTRWLLFGLVVTAGILNLVDRQIISVLKPQIAHDLNWTDDDYGTLAAWFQGAAAVAFLFTGWIADKLGVKWANPLGVAAWSIAAIAHGWAHSMVQFILCRVSLGATEAMGTPTGIKSIATIFPPSLRSAGFGLGNAANSMGAVLAPLAIPVVALVWGWRGTFIAAGVIGLAWAALWLLATRRIDFGSAQPAIAPPADGSAPDYGPILKDRRTWAIAGAKVLSDATWWLLLFWMPDFFNRQFGLSGVDLGPPLAVAYGGAAIGSLIGGLVPSRLLARGHDLNRVRKGVLLVSALLVLPVPLALQADNYWVAVGILALTLAAHQGFSTNLFALIADVTPQAKVGRVTSFGAFCGNLGGMAIAKIAGLTLAAGLGYLPLFLFASISYLLGIGWIQLLLPRLPQLRKAAA